MIPSDGAISSATSFRNFGGMESGPWALCGSRFLSSLVTHLVSMWNVDISGKGFDVITGTLDLSSSVKTLQNWLFITAVLTFGSL